MADQAQPLPPAPQPLPQPQVIHPAAPIPVALLNIALLQDQNLPAWRSIPDLFPREVFLVRPDGSYNDATLFIPRDQLHTIVPAPIVAPSSFPCTLGVLRPCAAALAQSPLHWQQPNGVNPAALNARQLMDALHLTAVLTVTQGALRKPTRDEIDQLVVRTQPDNIAPEQLAAIQQQARLNYYEDVAPPLPAPAPLPPQDPAAIQALIELASAPREEFQHPPPDPTAPVIPAMVCH